MFRLQFSLFASAMLFAGLSSGPALAARHPQTAHDTPHKKSHLLLTKTVLHRSSAHREETAEGASRHHRHKPHTAAALRHARRHGTEAVRAAARQAAIESAQDQTTEDAPKETASLAVPSVPLHYMNLPPLRGSHESLVRQNERAEQEGLLRVQDDADIETLRHNGGLVSLPVNAGIRVDDRLPENRRYCREWTGRFLSDLARVHYGRFHSTLQVNSAVRTVEYQRHLLHINGNAAPAEGDVASPHLTGATIDISKKGLSSSEIGWMRAYLFPLQSSGKIDVEEEFHQACFHITVYKSYTTGADPGTPWPSHRRGAVLIASRVR